MTLTKKRPESEIAIVTPKGHTFATASQILSWKEDAEKWNNFISKFPNIDFRRLEFIALREVGKEMESHKFG